MSINISLGDCHATICPQIGGSIASFKWRDRNILRAARAEGIEQRIVRQMGCYPLAPYSNRIGHAVLCVNGEQIPLRANTPTEPHAIHGFGWQGLWDVISRSENEVTLLLEHRPDRDWPFACRLTQKISLDENTLHLKLSLQNTDDRPMPAGLGFHPYFPVTAETSLETTWQRMWMMGPDSLPLKSVEVSPESDFHRARPIGDWKVDNCFTEWNRRAVLDYASHRVTIEASDACGQMICFRPSADSPYMALEPVTHIINAFALAAQGVPATGMKILAPQEVLSASMSISVADA
jgi:aldose 1-epimerase